MFEQNRGSDKKRIHDLVKLHDEFALVARLILIVKHIFH